MNQNPLISISVPVYNAEKHLRQCLDSLVNQTVKDIEIIIVNDGSTDSSEAICQEYTAKDSRIVLICKENGGLATARQTALEASKGLYFCACDADDWVEPDMYERLYKKAMVTDADIVMCDYWSEYPNGKNVASVYGKDPSRRKDLLDDLLNGKFPKPIWNKLIRKDLFSRYSLSWEPGINQGEDFLLAVKILRNNVSVAYVPQCLYHYRRIMEGTSYTNNITLSSFNQSLAIRQWVCNNLDLQRYANGVFQLWMNLAVTGLRVNEGMNKQYYKDEVLRNIPTISFFMYSYSKMKGALILLTKIFGYDFGRWLFQKVYKSIYK